MGYQGAERRMHRVYLTRNTEYHVQDHTCVAVRDRSTGRWIKGHFALGRSVRGAIRFFEDGGLTAARGLPRVGESLYFEAEGRDLVTSSIVAVERPSAQVVRSYGMASGASAA